jgi:Fe-S-cluster containining protein
MADTPWYEHGLKFACTGCGDCCTGDPGYVWVHRKEIAALARALGMDIGQFESQFVRRVGARKSLREHSNGDCVLFNPQTRQCLVYEQRPRQCRTWPFWESNVSTPRAWQDTTHACPGCGQGQLVPPERIETLVGVIRI